MWWWSNPPKTIYTIKCIVRNREKGTAGTTQQQSPAKFQVSPLFNGKKGENMNYENMKKIAKEYDDSVVIQSAQEFVDVEDAEYFFLCFKYPAEKIRPFEGELVKRFEDMGYDVSWCPEPESHGEEFEAVLNLL